MQLLANPGYDPKMEMLASFDPSNFDVQDCELTLDELTHHWGRIWAPFSGFELATREDKTVLVGAIFSAVLRQVLPTCPAFAFDAPMQGSGKTLLAETISVIGTAKKPSAVAPSRGDYDDEFRKRLMAIFLNGTKVCNFDNIVGNFDSPSLAGALTSETYEDRILGKSKTGRILNKTLFLFTGNNMQFVGDMSRRVLKARLCPKNDRVSERVFEFDPTERALEMRCEIISSVISVVNHWKHSGMVRVPGSMTSFGDWDRLVRQPIAYLGESLPETGLGDLLAISVDQQSHSGDKEALIALLKSLAAVLGIDTRFRASKALQAMHDQSSKIGQSLLADAVYAFISREKLQSSQHLGNLLKQFIDRNVEGLVLRARLQSGSNIYWVELNENSHRESIELMRQRSYSSALVDGDKIVSLPSIPRKTP